ncbi:hypothetical protein LEMLEM_LOCUS15273 [Lemmus lemmus]
MLPFSEVIVKLATNKREFLGAASATSPTPGPLRPARVSSSTPTLPGVRPCPGSPVPRPALTHAAASTTVGGVSHAGPGPRPWECEPPITASPREHSIQPEVLSTLPSDVVPIGARLITSTDETQRKLTVPVFRQGQKKLPTDSPLLLSSMH